MENKNRSFGKIIQEICEEENIDIEHFAHNWIYRLCKKNIYNYIIGYQFGLNSCSVHSICSDKSAASEIMTSFNIPNVEHIFFMSPNNQKYISQYGNWDKMIKLLDKYGKVVCKANEGTGGDEVYKVSNQYELENATFSIFGATHSMAISPYYDIQEEYRTIVLNGKIKLIYSKERPYIVGDGINTVNYLILKYSSEEQKSICLSDISQEDFNKVLKKGETYYLNWKHNLGLGAVAKIENSKEVREKIKEIIDLIINKMNVQFASIDIVKCNQEYKVLEINSGVMMECFSRQDESTYRIAKEIYREAILTTFQ